MTQPPLDFAELQALLEALCEETITADQMRRLEGLLLAHPEAEAYYVQYMSHQAYLVQHFGALPLVPHHVLREPPHPASAEPAAGQAPNPVELAPETPGGRHWPLRRGGLVLASLAALAAAVFFVVRATHQEPVGPGPSGPAAEVEDSTVAILLQAHQAEWVNTGVPTQAGAALPPGR